MNKLNFFVQFITSYYTVTLCNTKSLLDITVYFQIIIIYENTLFLNFQLYLVYKKLEIFNVHI